MSGPGALVAALTGPVGVLALPLLRALGNRRAASVVASAVPEPNSPLDLGALATTLERLGFDVSRGARARERWREPIDGAIVALDTNGSPVAFVKRSGRVLAVDAAGESPGDAAPGLAAARDTLHVRARFDLPLTEFDEDLRRVLTAGLVVSFAINLVALTIPLLTMVVFDRVIGGGAPEIVPGLALGGALALLAILAMRRARARLLAVAHARFGCALQRRVAERLLRAPLPVVGRWQNHAAVARVQEAWRPVDPLSHGLSTTVFDAPFVLLGLLVVAAIGGWIVLVPLGYLVLFLGVALLLERRSRLALQVAGTVAAEREAMLAELAEKAVELRLAGLEQSWLARFAELSRRAAALGVGGTTRAAFTQAVGYVLGTGMALATLAVGVGLVLGGAMTAGGLIATMLLVWRVNGPCQALFFSLGRLRQARDQRARAEALLRTPVEADQPARLHDAPECTPVIEFDRVSFRHAGAAEQALTGVSLRIAPGEVVAVTGPTGSGKSTLLQVAAGLLQPQIGAVLVEGENLAHVDPDEYRLRVAAFIPPSPHAFLVPPEDDVALAAPWLDDSAMLRRAGDAWARLGQARLTAKAPAVAILDAPLRGAGDGARAAFESFLAEGRGRRTVVFSTDDPGAALLADKVIVLDRGQTRYFGAPRREAAPVAELDHA